jgi:Flp pilus assembly protein TadD
MTQAFTAALSHPNPNARVMATYGDYAWNVLGNHELAEHLINEAVKTNPGEPAYRITQIRMLVALGRHDQARTSITELRSLNFGGRLNIDIAELNKLLSKQ